MNFLDRILDLILEWIGFFIPWHVMPDDEIGLVQRLGKYHRDTKPGLNWTIPLLESVTTTSGAVDSSALREQTLTTSDGVQVTIRGVITYRAVDPRKYILNCEDAESVLNDVGCSVIAETVTEQPSNMVLGSSKFVSLLCRRVKARSKRWGIEVSSFALMDRAQSVSVRLISGTGE